MVENQVHVSVVRSFMLNFFVTHGAVVAHIQKGFNPVPDLVEGIHEGIAPGRGDNMEGPVFSRQIRDLDGSLPGRDETPTDVITQFLADLEWEVRRRVKRECPLSARQQIHSGEAEDDDQEDDVDTNFIVIHIFFFLLIY
jgi:hypothetical protein